MRSLIVGVAVLAVAVPLFAQSSVKVDVRVINVDVSVIDAKGKPVTDLKADDFEVLEDNQPQKITNFSTADRAAARAALSSRTPSNLQLRRRVILLVDNNYIDKTDRDNALRSLDAFIDDTYDGTYEWALAMIGQQLEIVQPFTTDKPAIHAAIAKIRGAATTSFRDVMDRGVLDDQLFQRNGLDSAAQFESRDRTQRNARSLANTARGIIDATHAFATTEGKKLAVLLTGNMDLSTSFSSFDSGSDRELQDAKTTTAKIIDAIVTEANAANTSIHVMRVATHQNAVPQHDVTNQSSGNGIEGMNINASSDVRDTSSPWTIAAGTGGLFLANAPRDSFATIDAAAGTFYLLGYEPPHQEDRQYHRITVRVKRPGTRVVYRQGYIDLTEEERLEDLLRMRISILQPSADLPVTLNVSNLNVPDGKPAVSMLVSMPFTRVTLLPKDGKFVGRVHVYFAVFDANGKNVGFRHQVQDVALTAEQRDKAAADAFRYKMNVRLDKGDFVVAMTLRDDLSNEIGTAVQKVKL